MKFWLAVGGLVLVLSGPASANNPHLTIPRGKEAIAHADFRQPKVHHCTRLSTSTITCIVREHVRESEISRGEWIVRWLDIRATRTGGEGVRVWSPDVGGLRHIYSRHSSTIV